MEICEAVEEVDRRELRMSAIRAATLVGHSLPGKRVP